MNRVQKYEQTDQIMAYLESNKVRSLFNNLLKQLVVHKPDAPLDFLIEKLQAPIGKFKNFFNRLLVKRYILIGPSADRKKFARKLKEDFRLTVIDCGALIKNEIFKAADDKEKTDALQEKIDNHILGKCNDHLTSLVDDRAMVELVKKRVEECEKEARSYVLEGFPRTKVQALALEEMGVLPDKVFNRFEPNSCQHIDDPDLIAIDEGNVPSLLPLFP